MRVTDRQTGHMSKEAEELTIFSNAATTQKASCGALAKEGYGQVVSKAHKLHTGGLVNGQFQERDEGQAMS